MNKEDIKYRIVDYYSPHCGNWYVVQFKVFLFWHTLKMSFKSLQQAKDFVEYYQQNVEFTNDIFDKPVKTLFISRNNGWFKVVDGYGKRGKEKRYFPVYKKDLK